MQEYTEGIFYLVSIFISSLNKKMYICSRKNLFISGEHIFISAEQMSISDKQIFISGEQIILHDFAIPF